MLNTSRFKATAISPANIAFIKYWGKKDSEINFPFNSSISMNLDRCLTTTTVEFGRHYRNDRIFIDGKEVLEEKKERVIKILDIVRRRTGLKWNAKVVSKNSFPTDAGIASSASAFSALALSASKASGLSLSEKELSILARLGSGSACRSMVGGFAEWKKGKDSQSSYAIQLAPPDFWDLRDVVCSCQGKEKS